MIESGARLINAYSLPMNGFEGAHVVSSEKDMGGNSSQSWEEFPPRKGRVRCVSGKRNQTVSCKPLRFPQVTVFLVWGSRVILR